VVIGLCDDEQAESSVKECLALAQSINDLSSVSHFVKSLELYREREASWGRASFLTGFAGVAKGQGWVERAAQILGASGKFQASPGGWRESIFQAEYERIIASAHRVLGEEAFEAAAAKGRAMTLDEAMAFALEG
jgi:hypothetical protein